MNDVSLRVNEILFERLGATSLGKVTYCTVQYHLKFYFVSNDGNK